MASGFVQQLDSIPSVAERVLDVAAGRARALIALVGPPGAGKSTVAEQLGADVNRLAGTTVCKVVPMDGYHLDDVILNARGWRFYKGAPYTFDVAGLAGLLRRLRDEVVPVYYPVFDRTLELSRNAAAAVNPEDRIILVEGNWLLLSAPPWHQLAELFDLSIRLEVPEAVLQERLKQRWLDLGLDDGQARSRIEDNDLPNGRLVLSGSRPADILLNNG